MQTRLRKPVISRTTFAVVPLTAALVSYGVSSLFDAGLDRSLAISGSVFALATYVVAEFRERAVPRKRVVYIGQEDTLFASNIVDGLRHELSSGVPHDLTIHTPKQVGDTVDWQYQKLHGLQARDCDALVILPASGEARIWNAIVRLMLDKTFVLVLDFEPPRSIFYERGLTPPPMVASDFRSGGELIGHFIAEQLQSDPDLIVVLAIGPQHSWAGSVRSSSALYTVSLLGLGDRVRAVALRSWNVDEAGDDIAAAISAAITTSGTRVLAFCGDDRIVAAVSERLRGSADLETQLRFIGYDGTLDLEGRLSVSTVPGAIATLDTRPRAQGVAAGQVLREAYEGGRTPSAPLTLVVPRLVLGPAWE